MRLILLFYQEKQDLEKVYNCIAKEKDKFKVGDSFESCTTQTSSQTIKNEENKCNLFVIDTPGFEDSER